MQFLCGFLLTPTFGRLENISVANQKNYYDISIKKEDLLRRFDWINPSFCSWYLKLMSKSLFKLLKKLLASRRSILPLSALKNVCKMITKLNNFMMVTTMPSTRGTADPTNRDAQVLFNFSVVFSVLFFSTASAFGADLIHQTFHNGKGQSKYFTCKIRKKFSFNLTTFFQALVWKDADFFLTSSEFKPISEPLLILSRLLIAGLLKKAWFFKVKFVMFWELNWTYEDPFLSVRK